MKRIEISTNRPSFWGQLRSLALQMSNCRKKMWLNVEETLSNDYAWWVDDDGSKNIFFLFLFFHQILWNRVHFIFGMPQFQNMMALLSTTFRHSSRNEKCTKLTNHHRVGTGHELSDTKENILLKTNNIFWSGSSSGEEPGEFTGNSGGRWKIRLLTAIYFPLLCTSHTYSALRSRWNWWPNEFYLF